MKSAAVFGMCAVAVSASAEIVAFKDADKIKSWDAWSDHKTKPVITNILQKEKRCVTLEKLNALDWGLKEIGRLPARSSSEIRSSKWSVGCETMDRDYADWDSFKALLPGLGVKHARFFSGWAKTEQERGVYDFTWLDPQIRECAAMDIRPWICISYGNPVWGSDFRLGMRVKQVTDKPEAFEAWLRYTKTLVARYQDVVDEWEVWNEPFNQGPEYAEMFYRTAKAIREVQPAAKIFCTAITFNSVDPGKNDYRYVLEKLKRENALDLASYFIYHPYHVNPDESYDRVQDGRNNNAAIPLRRFVKSYSPAFDIMQGEVGCPSQLEFAHAMCNREWTEYSQAKWDLRRTIGDAVRGIPCNVFTMIDLKYTFMLQSFGLVRSNLLKEFVYRRPSYFAMRNVFSWLDDESNPVGLEKFPIAGRELSVATFVRNGKRWRFVWFSDEIPSSDLSFTKVDLTAAIGSCRAPVLVDMITGRIFETKDLKAVPVWDSPVLIAEKWFVPFDTEWSKLTGGEIVDTWYKRHQRGPMKAFPDSMKDEPWLDWPAEKFLPCIDRFGQFKWREWPGKIHNDAELKTARNEEEKDLAVNPGPDDRNRYGGWAKGPQLEATGRFRTHKDAKGKWWLVDPEGRLFWSFGAVRVTPSSAMTPMNGDKDSIGIGYHLPDRDCFFEDLPPSTLTPHPSPLTPYSRFWHTHDDLLWPFYLVRGETRVYDLSSANLYRKYGEDYYARFADSAHRRLRSWGLNTIANSSDVKICLMDRTPYAERVEVKGGVVLSGSWGNWGKFRDPFAETFASDVIRSLAEHDQEAHDKWCIGFFVDNEIQWGGKHEDLAVWTLWSRDDQPAKVEFLKRLTAKGIVYDGNWKSVPKAELEAFTDALCEEYFRRTRKAVKDFDSKLMYLGCRYAGAPEWSVRPCAKYCDVVSWNIYRDTIESWRIPGGFDAPVLCGEFHFGATDRGPFGTGVRQAKDQNDRAAKMKAYVESALANPQIVGVHWHQFSDQAVTGRFDGEGLQVGFTDVCDQPYPEMRQALRAVGYSMYETRSGINNGNP